MQIPRGRAAGATALVDRLVFSLVFSGAWVAGAAGALAAAAAAALGSTLSPAALALVASGTFTIYGVDRLRDIDGDRTTSPRRAAFVARHRGPLRIATACAALLAGGLAVRAGWAVLCLAAGIGGMGLLHRRLKRASAAKGFYVAAAWTLITVGIPALEMRAAAAPAAGGPAAAAASGAPSPSDTAWIAGVLGAVLLANAMASSLRDHEGLTRRLGHARTLAAARALAGCGIVLALAAPPGIHALAFVPLATAAALAAFRRDEAYAGLVLDGSLTAGALLALALTPG